jgi:hypothetical protein
MADRDLTHCNPIFVTRFLPLKGEYEAKYPDRTLLVTCTRRTTDEQRAEWAKGRTTPGKRVTDKDGVVKKSDHQARADGLSTAVDVAVVLHKGKFDSYIDWRPPLYVDLGKLALDHKLRWGGTWGDYCHLELA